MSVTNRRGCVIYTFYLSLSLSLSLSNFLLARLLFFFILSFLHARSYFPREA